MLVAIEIILAITPLGSLRLGPGIVATLAHIPVIIAAVLLGPAAGMFMGGVFGLLSFLVWTFMPPDVVSAGLFTPFYPLPGLEHGSWLSLIVVFVPRVLLGLFAALLYRFFAKFDKKKYVSYIASGVLASVLHTVMVLGSMYLFFSGKIAEIFPNFGLSFAAYIYTTAGINGVMEAVIAGVLTVAIVAPLKRLLPKAIGR